MMEAGNHRLGDDPAKWLDRTASWCPPFLIFAMCPQNWYGVLTMTALTTGPSFGTTLWIGRGALDSLSIERIASRPPARVNLLFAVQVGFWAALRSMRGGANIDEQSLRVKTVPTAPWPARQGRVIFLRHRRVFFQSIATK